jgi:hypothetical protein
MTTDPKIPMLSRIKNVEINSFENFIKIQTHEQYYSFDLNMYEIQIGLKVHHVSAAYKKRFVRKAVLWLQKVYTRKIEII